MTRPDTAKQRSLLEDYVSKKVLAQEFQVSERTIERWVRLRILPAPLRLGRLSLYHLPSLREHLSEAATVKKSRSGRPR